MDTELTSTWKQFRFKASCLLVALRVIFSAFHLARNKNTWGIELFKCSVQGGVGGAHLFSKDENEINIFTLHVISFLIFVCLDIWQLFQSPMSSNAEFSTGNAFTLAHHQSGACLSVHGAPLPFHDGANVFCLHNPGIVVDKIPALPTPQKH